MNVRANEPVKPFVLSPVNTALAVPASTLSLYVTTMPPSTVSVSVVPSLSLSTSRVAESVSPHGFISLPV